jgi:hypothetical protein
MPQPSSCSKAVAFYCIKTIIFSLMTTIIAKTFKPERFGMDMVYEIIIKMGVVLIYYVVGTCWLFA